MPTPDDGRRFEVILACLNASRTRFGLADAESVRRMAAWDASGAQPADPVLHDCLAVFGLIAVHHCQWFESMVSRGKEVDARGRETAERLGTLLDGLPSPLPEIANARQAGLAAGHAIECLNRLGGGGGCDGPLLAGAVMEALRWRGPDGSFMESCNGIVDVPGAALAAAQALIEGGDALILTSGPLSPRGLAWFCAAARVRFDAATLSSIKRSDAWCAAMRPRLTRVLTQAAAAWSGGEGAAFHEALDEARTQVQAFNAAHPRAGDTLQEPAMDCIEGAVKDALAMQEARWRLDGEAKRSPRMRA